MPTTGEQIRELQGIFGGGLFGGLAAVVLVAIVTLFVLLMRSYTHRAEQSALYFAATEKFRELSERVVELLEDDASLRRMREKRRAAEREKEVTARLPKEGG